MYTGYVQVTGIIILITQKQLLEEFLLRLLSTANSMNDFLSMKTSHTPQELGTYIYIYGLGSSQLNEQPYVKIQYVCTHTYINIQTNPFSMYILLMTWSHDMHYSGIGRVLVTRLLVIWLAGWSFGQFKRPACATCKSEGSYLHQQ